MNTPVAMIALARQTYNGRALKTDDSFDATSEEEAADLVAVRMAVRAKPTARVLTKSIAPQETFTRAMAPTKAEDDSEGPNDENIQPVKIVDKGNYNRRDMRAKR